MHIHSYVIKLTGTISGNLTSNSLMTSAGTFAHNPCSYSSIKGSQPPGTTWADGYSHLAFFELSKYYISAYKTGSYPAITVSYFRYICRSWRLLPPQEDTIYFWARPHPAQATAHGDPLARPTGFNFAEVCLFPSSWVSWLTYYIGLSLDASSCDTTRASDAGLRKLEATVHCR